MKQMKPCRHVGYEPDCRVCWLARYDPRFHRLYRMPGKKAEKMPENSVYQPTKAKELERLVVCVHLGVRLEHREGCGGMRCRHTCELDLPAVPGGYCQTCTSYEGDFNEDGVTGPGWLS